jgi:hypothetical protein
MKRKLPLSPSVVRSSSKSREARGAIGWSLLYMVFGGGLVGAIVIYLVVKMLGG